MIDERFAEPRAQTIQALRDCPGDVAVLGAGGKMGPSLSLMLRGAADMVAHGRRVIAVSRWSNTRVRAELESRGVETLECDLLDRDAVNALPDAANVVFMAGQKFGTTEAPHRTWAMNTLVPHFCADRFASSRIVAFSTGNVYPLSPIGSSGSRESDPLGPVGDYAGSCVGRERVFEHAADGGTRVAIVRLNYAVELRYGVLLDIAQHVYAGTPVPLSMGCVNVIWQADANQRAIECLPHAASPPFVINVTGQDALRVRTIADRFAERFDRAPVFSGEESADALLSDTSRMVETLGAATTSFETMICAVGDWVKNGGGTLGKPTGFETRDGRF